MFSRPVLAVLRSQSRVFFQARWVTGLLFLLAFTRVPQLMGTRGW
jgi:hypothetical protein